MLELARYVVLNPVRAGMVNDAADWIWSSHQAMLGREASPAWLEVDALLKAFGRTRAKATAGYVDFVRAGVGLPPIWESLRGQMYLGSDAFVEQMQGLVQDGQQLTEVPRLQRRPVAKPLARYEAEHPRNEAMALAYLSGDHSMRSIAEHFGIHYVTVSRAVKQHENTQSRTVPQKNRNPLKGRRRGTKNDQATR